MSIYDSRKQIQKLIDESSYGLVKGDIYNELSELRIDNDFITEINVNSEKREITFKIKNEAKNKIDNLIEQINEVIKSFIYKNLKNINDEFKNDIESQYCFDKYIFDSGEEILLIIQL